MTSTGSFYGSKHLGSDYPVKDGFVLTLNGKLFGYALFYPCSKRDAKRMGFRSRAVLLDWIWAPGYGRVAFLTKLIRKWRRAEYEGIVLKVSVDRQATVVRHLNFWYRNRFQAQHIAFRDTHGPLLTMTRSI